MKVKDPVCGMTIEDSNAASVSMYRGTTYYFCSSPCKEDFDKDPEAYINAKAGSALKTEELKSGKMFTCPMHPEVVRDAPEAAPSAAWHSSRGLYRLRKKKIPNSCR
jgi:Cu+-exporting ATPase